jgi:tetratricopeptide (TPR) repeat protein
VKNYPKWSEPSFYLGLSQLASGEIQLAQKSVEDAIKKSPRNTKYHTLLAQISLLQGDSDTAKKEAAIALKIDPHNFQAAMFLTQAMLLGKDFDNAAKLLENFNEKVPNNLQILGNLGIAYLGEKKKDKAIDIFSKILKLSPGNSKALAILTGLTSKGDLNKAVNLIKKQIAKAPEAGGHYILLGDIYLKQQKFEKALDAFKKAKELIPQNPQPYLVIAGIMRKLGKVDQAIAEYRELIKAHPDSASAHMGLASLFEAQGNYPEARKEYKATLNISPNFAPAANNLAWLITQEPSPDLGEALRLAMIAKQKFPEEPHIADTLGYVHYKRQAYSLAQSQFEQALQRVPNDPTINYHLALTLHAEKQTDKALASLKKALEAKGNFKDRKNAESLLNQWEKK